MDKLKQIKSKKNFLWACMSAISVVTVQFLYMHQYMCDYNIYPTTPNDLKGLYFNFVCMGLMDLVLIILSYRLFLSCIPGVLTGLVIAFSDCLLKILVCINPSILDNISVAVLFFLIGCLFFLMARFSTQYQKNIFYCISAGAFLFASKNQIFVFLFAVFIIIMCIIVECIYQRGREAMKLVLLLLAFLSLEFFFFAPQNLFIIRQCVLGDQKKITFPYLINTDYCLSFLSYDTLHINWFFDRFVIQILLFFVLIVCVLGCFVFALCRKEKWYPKMKDKFYSIVSEKKAFILKILSDKNKLRANMYLQLIIAMFITVFCMARCLDVWNEYNKANECFYFLMPLFILLLSGCIFKIIRQIKWNHNRLQLCLFSGAVICVLIIAKMKNIPQEYDQFIIENLAFLGTNKTNELKVFYIYLFLSLLLAFIVGYFYVKRERNDKYICRYSLDIKKKIVPAILFFIFYALSIYGISASINLMVAFSINATFCIGMSIVMSVISIFFPFFIQVKLMICLQCMIPLSLLIYINSNYLYDGKIIRMVGSVSYVLIILLAVIVLEYLNIRHCICIKKAWKTQTVENGLCNVVSNYTCLIIAAFAAFPGASLIVTDSHHPGEIIISFKEIFEKGASLYQDYFPVSGLFSVILGGINELLGGKYSYAALTSALFCMLVAIVTAWVLCKYMQNYYVAILSFFITLALPPYMIRTQFILPFVLILFLPKLRKKYQLLLYLLFSLIMVLYYPLYGVAFAVGLFPYEIYILWREVSEVKEKKNLIDLKVWIYGVLLLLIYLCCIPLLWKMAKHMLIYSSQSLLADGYTVIGQEVPDDFLTLLKSYEGIRKLIFYALWFFVPISILSVCSYCIGKQFKEGWKKVFKNRYFYIMLFIIVFSGISFSYSQMRVETNLLGRTAGVLFPLIPILFSVICYERKTSSYQHFLYGILLFVLLVSYDGSMLSDIKNHFISKYDVDKSLIYVDKDIENIGVGFFEPNIYEDCVDFKNITNYYGNDVYYTGLYFAQIYASDIKAIGQPNMIAMKSKAAIDETVGLFYDRDVVVANKMTPYGQYRWNKFLMTSDEMIYDSRTNCFVSKKLSKKMNIVGDDKSLYHYQMENIGALANTLGKSFVTYGADWLNDGNAKVISGNISTQTLSDETGSLYCKNYTFDISEKIDGKNNDFLFIQLDCENDAINEYGLDEKLKWHVDNTDIVVDVSWQDEEEMDSHIYAYLGNGKLLFPLGMNSSWYNTNQQKISVSIMSSEKAVDEIDINNIAFYQLVD